MKAQLSWSSWTTWAAFLGFWTVIGLVFSTQFYLSNSVFGYSSVTWREAIAFSLGDWYLWAILSLLIVRLGHAFPFHRRNLAKRVVIHVAASAMISAVYIVVRAAIAQLQGPMLGFTSTLGGNLQALFLKNSLFNLSVYWVILSVSQAFDYYRKLQEREWRTAELERRLAEAKLMALQMQLNPHFLFNTLHTISALMHKDVEAADRMIARLSELLRLALENTDANEVSLGEELDFLKRYLEIEQTRFGERLAVRMDIAPDTLNLRVPNLLLQPLVENAIRHGIEPHARPGVIELSSHRKQGRLHLQVRDNGAGLPSGVTVEGGVGVSNTRARLQHLYGDCHALEFSSSAQGGLVVNVTLPLKETSGPAKP